MAARISELIVAPGHALGRSIHGTGGLDALDPLSQVPPLPAGYRERFGWLVGEMDAWRGSVQDSGQESVPDPHELSSDEHPRVQAQITALVTSFSASVKTVIES